MKAYLVETNDLRNNIAYLQSCAGDAPFWAVLKGSAYGLGLIPMARVCAECGVTRFCVTETDDVKALRDAGFSSAQILMLRPTCSDAEIRTLLGLGAIFTVSGQDDAAVLNGIAQQMGVVAEAHLKIDTGMGRYGYLPGEIDKMLPVYQYMDGIAVSGIYTHLHSAFGKKKTAEAQFAAFDRVLSALTAAGVESGTPHVLNSCGLLRFPERVMGGVRVGSALLGRTPVACKELKRIGVCEAQIEELRWLPKGHTCGYGAGWKAKRPTRIAVLSVGWYHGFGMERGTDIFRLRDRLRGVVSALKNFVAPRRFTVSVNGKKCRVLGHIGMLHTVADVTKVPCALGDRALLEISPTFLRGMDVIFK